MTTLRSSLIQARAATTRRRDRQGFTLIEIMIALLIFVIGVLAMTASSAMTMRMIGGTQRLTVASTVAEGRFEKLRGEGCSAHANGTTTTFGVREAWDIVPLAQADDVTVRVTFPVSGGRVVSQAYRTYIIC